MGPTPDYDEVLRKINEPTADLYTHSQHNRFLIRLLIAAVIVLTGVVGWNVWLDSKISTNNARIVRDSQSIYAICTARNDSRARLVQVFSEVLSVHAIHTSGATSDTTAEIAYVKSQFPLVNCGPKP